MKKRTFKFLSNKVEYLILIAVILFSIFLKLLFIGSQLTNGIQLSNTLDFSWVTDIVERFLHGFIAGRDFIFTYGPLYQIIQSLPSILFKLPSYESYLYAQILLIVPVSLLVFFITKLITSDKKEQIVLFIYLFFIVGLILFDDSSTLFRIIVPIFYALIYIRYASIHKNFSIRKLLILALPTFFGLYSFDLFLLGFLLTLLLIIYEILLLYFPQIVYRKKIRSINLKKIIFNGIFSLGIILTFEIIASLMLSNNLNYLIYSYDTVRNYQYMGNIPWTINKPYILFLFPASLIIVFIYFLKRITNPTLRQTGIILTLIAILGIRTGFYRTDEAHILFGVYPSIIVVFILLFFLIRRNGLNLFIVCFFIPLYLLIPFKNDIYSSISAKHLMSAIYYINKPISFFDLYKLSNNYYFNDQDFRYFASLIKSNPQNVLIYPTDIYILNIYGETYNTLPILFHDASNTLIEKKAIERLSKSPPKYIILCIDSASAVSLDGIPNFSKNSYLAKWMISNYSIYENKKNYLILRFNAKKKDSQELLKENNSKVNCDIYEINTTNIMHGDIIENYFKPSSFYLESINTTKSSLLHLPYHADMKSLLIVDKYSNPEQIRKLFERDINFEKFVVEEKNNIKIIKKYFLPFLKKEFIAPFSAKCY